MSNTPAARSPSAARSTSGRPRIRWATVSSSRLAASVATRRWDPGAKDWRFTTLGNNFYRHLRRNYVCQVPVTVHGARDDGTEYTFRTYFPISKLGVDSLQLPLNLTAAERLEKVKQIVARSLPANTIIYKVSRERYEVDTHAHAAWFLSEETVAVRGQRAARPSNRRKAEL